jgi:tetratricopeptide (TPR) repeat protein
MLADITQKYLARGILIAAPMACFLGLAGYGWLSPNSRFLIPFPGAEWIDYPVPPRSILLADNPRQHTVFRRSFELSTRPDHANLRLRAFRECKLTINGNEIQLPSVKRWNQCRSANVADYLRSGSNEIAVWVTNDVGPPVLWLSLIGPECSIVSDDQWTASLDGAIEMVAHRAGQPLLLRPGHPIEGRTQTLDALRLSLPVLAMFAGIGAAAYFLVWLLARWTHGFAYFGMSNPALAIGLPAACLLWIAILSHNGSNLSRFQIGFDGTQHLNYIRYIQEKNTLPLADEGWEMHQPPLYYMLAARLLSLRNMTVHSENALTLLRHVGLAMGLMELVLIAASLALLFPDNPRRQLLGLTLATFLPMHIYLFQYVTNEALLMVLATADIYLLLRVLRAPRPSWASCIVLGFCMGLTLLTKVTGLVVVGAALLVLGGTLFTRQRMGGVAGVTRFLSTALVTGLVCGWHYARVWRRFGTPFIGSYDADSGYRWWMDPGYGTARFFFDFGRSLWDPFYSGLFGLIDGMYSTAFGDGLCSGTAAWSDRPPWNYDLMASGYLLGLIPSIAILAGLLWALIRVWRKPEASWFLLLTCLGGLAAATLFQLMRYPYFAHFKAFYWANISLAICAFGATGLDILFRSNRALAATGAVMLGTWACVAYFSFWIQQDSAAARTWTGIQFLNKHQDAQAESFFRRALDANPADTAARLCLVASLNSPGRYSEMRNELTKLLRDDPNNAEALLILSAAIFYHENNVVECIKLLQHVVQVAPDHPQAYWILGVMLMRSDRRHEAIDAFRRSLQIDPTNAPSVRANLGLLLAQTGHPEEAIAQYQQALVTCPNQPILLAHSSWLLATQEKPSLRKPAQALELAQLACTLTNFGDVAALQAFAAAQAASGRFDYALTAARRAVQLGVKIHPSTRVPMLQEQISCYERGELFYSSAPPQQEPYPGLPPVRVLKISDL